MYFQKSKVFLFPYLNIPNHAPFKPESSFIKDIYKGITEQDYKLVVVYRKSERERDFFSFEQKYLLSSKYFSDFYSCTDFLIYIFDLKVYKDDWNKILTGKYSELSTLGKKLIDNYHTEVQANRRIRTKKIVDTLYPTDIVLQEYASDLEIDIDILRDIGEVCDIYDEIKETIDMSDCFSRENILPL